LEGPVIETWVDRMKMEEEIVLGWTRLVSVGERKMEEDGRRWRKDGCENDLLDSWHYIARDILYPLDSLFERNSL
jgi:hypothetical protein